MKQKKQRTKRNQSEYPALDPRLNPKTRSEQNDYDYINDFPEMWTDPHTGKEWTKHQLKQYLNDFTNEYLHASFNKDSKKRIHKKKKVPSEKNKGIKELKDKLNDMFKTIHDLINDTQVSTKSKINLRKMIIKVKRRVREVLNKELTMINDYYRNEAEKRNNIRNSCILTSNKAQGKTLGVADFPESYYNNANNNPEDEMIERLDLLKELQKTKNESNDT